MNCKIKIECYSEGLYDIWFHRFIVISIEDDEHTFQFLGGGERIEICASPNMKNIRLLAKLKIESEKYRQIKEAIVEKIK